MSKTEVSVKGSKAVKVAEASEKGSKVVKVETVPMNSEGWPHTFEGTLALAAALFGVNEVIYRIFRRRAPYKKKPAKDVVYVFQFRRTHSMPNLSPKCLALETWLRTAKINFEIVDDNPWLHDASTSVLPLIELNGKQYASLQTMIDEISKLFPTDNLEPGVATAVSETTENEIEQLMWCYFYFRCVLNEKELLSKEKIGVNNPMEPIMPWTSDVLFKMMINKDSAYQSGERDGIAKKLVAHMKELVLRNGFKSERSYRELGFACLDTISTTLAEKRYLFSNEKPSATDTFLFGVTAQIFYGPYKSPFKKYLMDKHRNLIDHCYAMKTLAWPDWDNMLRATID